MSFFLPGSSQYRFAHSDVRVPDFTDYRKDAVKDAGSSAAVSGDSRKAFSYAIVAGQIHIDMAK